MSKKSGILFSVKSSLTLDEYKKMFKCIPTFYLSIMKSVAVRELMVILIISLISKTSLLATFIIYIIILILLGFIYKIKIDYLAEKVYKKYPSEYQLDGIGFIDFYDSYLICRNDNLERKVDYLNVSKLVETETNFYLQTLNKIINISKSDCDEELMDFIRNLCNTYRKYESKKVKKVKNHTSKKNMLIILFILTISSIYGASLTLDVVLGDKPAILSNDYIWVFWFWLPIPILSIILGFKYKSHGFKCTKNIVAGFIIGISLLAFGSFSFIFPSMEIDYANINNYSKILNVDFPSKGILTQEKYDTLFDKDKTNITNTQAFYKKSINVKDFEKSIIHGENWIKASEIKTELKMLLPSQLRDSTCKSCYFLIFNKDTDEYNKVPSIQGDFHVYTSLYDLDNRILTITDFDYEYK